MSAAGRPTAPVGLPDGEAPAGPPSPHPLDFDWRFDEATSLRLSDMLRDVAPVLALGAPSVARLLERSVPVTLVDRQPFQGVRDHVRTAMEDFVPAGGYRSAIVDPPWYPLQFEAWAAVAANAVGVGGTVFMSAWPPDTRPGAQEELETLLHGIAAWADVRRNVGVPTYSEPGFESVARTLESERALSRSPLAGELIRLEVRGRPALVGEQTAGERWLRFVLDDYQLALRMPADVTPLNIREVPGAGGWHWPFVSARAPGRGLIDLWSSENEVARVGGAHELAAILRKAARSGNPSAFDAALEAVPELKSWRIPRPPYRRSIEWQHRQ